MKIELGLLSIRDPIRIRVISVGPGPEVRRLSRIVMASFLDSSSLVLELTGDLLYKIL